MTNTITLQNAKKLKEVADKYGVELPSSEYWYLTSTGQKLHWDNLPEYCKEHETLDDSVQAYTTDELLEWLPENTTLISKIKDERIDGGYMAIYKDVRELDIAPQDALCLLAISLIKKRKEL